MEVCNVVDPHHPCRCRISAETLPLAPFCFHVLVKDGLPNAHATTPLDLILTCLFDSCWVERSSMNVVDKDLTRQAIFMR